LNCFSDFITAAEAKDQPMKRSVTFDPKLRSPSIDSRTSSSGSVEQKKGFGFFNRRPSDATRKNSDAKKPTEAPRKESDAPRKQSDAPRKDSDAQSKSSEASTNGEVSPNLTPEGGIRKSILQILNEPEDPNEDVLTRDKKQRKKKKLRKCLDALAEGGKYTITDDYVWYEPPNKKDKKKDVDDEGEFSVSFLTNMSALQKLKSKTRTKQRKERREIQRSTLLMKEHSSRG
jgi:hypothetical protein